MKSNIYSLYIIKIAKWFNLVMPTIVLFYQNLGMGMQEIFLLKSIYSVVIVVFEIPSGYCADAWGRKKTLVAGSVLGTLGFVIYSTNTLFAGFVAAELILGLGHSLISGADTAMLYDTLKSEHKATAYLKHEGRITAGGNFAEALAGITGGLLATISLRTPFMAQVAVAASAIPAALLLKEPALNTLRDRQLSFRTLITSAHNAITRHPTLPWVLLLSSFTGTATLTYAWLVQPYFKAAGLPLALYGVMWTLLNLNVGAVGLFAYRLERRLGQQTCMIGVVVVIAGSYFLTGRYISLQAVAVLFVFYTARGMATPVLKEYINRDCASAVRATILSLRNFIIRINFAAAGPVLGWVVDHHSLNSAYWLAGGAYLTAGAACLGFFTFRKHTIRPHPEKT
ncbi:MAG: MFS transporter [Desulfobacteraceae bacterium]